MSKISETKLREQASKKADERIKEGIIKKDQKEAFIRGYLRGSSKF